MENRLLLDQSRRGFAFHIAKSPDTVTIRRPGLVDDGYGNMVTDPYGSTTDVVLTARLSHERSGVQKQQDQPSGLDTALSLYLLWPWNVTVNEGETISSRGRLFKVGVPDALTKFGGVQVWQAPLIPAGTVSA